MPWETDKRSGVAVPLHAGTVCVLATPSGTRPRGLVEVADGEAGAHRPVGSVPGVRQVRARRDERRGVSPRRGVVAADARRPGVALGVCVARGGVAVPARGRVAQGTEGGRV